METLANREDRSTAVTSTAPRKYARRCPPACGGTDRGFARSRGVHELRSQPDRTAAAGSHRNSRDFFLNPLDKDRILSYPSDTIEHMFERWDARKNWSEKVDELERRVLAKEAEISRLRAEQAGDLRILDQLQVDLGDGDRCMDAWVQAHLDVSHQTAARLMQVARTSDRSTIDNMRAGSWGLDRASLLLRLSQAGATPEQVADVADNYAHGRIYGLMLELKEISPL